MHCKQWTVVHCAAVVGCLGLVGNLVSLLVLNTTGETNCFNRLLTALNLTDR